MAMGSVRPSGDRRRYPRERRSHAVAASSRRRPDFVEDDVERVSALAGWCPDVARAAQAHKHNAPARARALPCAHQGRTSWPDTRLLGDRVVVNVNHASCVWHGAAQKRRPDAAGPRFGASALPCPTAP